MKTREERKIKDKEKDKERRRVWQWTMGDKRKI